jgi:transcriptional regulator
MSAKNELLPGTLDLLVLRVLAGGRQHGYGIGRRIRSLSSDVLQIEEGSLYPALHRMEVRGWIRAEWAESEARRRAKYYTLSAAGRKQLALETKTWETFAGAVARVLGAEG